MSLFVPAGHFYSPIVNGEEARKDEARIWPGASVTPGIDLRREAQGAFIRDSIALYRNDFDPYSAAVPGSQYDAKNDQFPAVDAVVLFSMLRAVAPRRVIEVGSGYSTLVTCEAKRRFLPSLQILCIEPYPPDILVRSGNPGIDGAVQRRAQDTPMEVYDLLQPGDVLFIDSSHVAKTGSDVNFLFFDVLPRLPAGTFVHVHDIFLPEDYPKSWVINEQRSWNEQYLLQARLTGAADFEVLFGTWYAGRHLRDPFAAAARVEHLDGTSFWMRKIA